MKLRPQGESSSPFVVAHRSGNTLADLRRMEELGIRAIEADVRLFRGRLEVRHLKTVGPIPLLWDRWTVASPFAPRLVAADLLAAVGPSTELMLDLKGRDRRLSERLLATLEPHLRAGLELVLCARSWPLLEPFRGLDGVRLVHSVGSARQLARLRRRFAGGRLHGVSIHERLLDSATARDLRELADVTLAWPVNTVERAQELLALGVHGLISDRPGLVAPVVARAESA